MKLRMKFLGWTAPLLAALLMTTSVSAHPQSCTPPNLTGTYGGDDGGVYYVQQSGTVLSWAGLSSDSGMNPDGVWHRGLEFTNVFRGTINCDYTVTGNWSDVTRGSILQSGTLDLSISYFNGNLRLTILSQTGNFGGTILTQRSPLDDTRQDTLILDIIDRFDDARKNDDTSIHDNLKPYRDQTVFYARVVASHVDYIADNHPVESEIPHVNYGTIFETIFPPPIWPFIDPGIPSFLNFGRENRDPGSFFANGSEGDGDFDVRLKVDMDKLEPDFYTTGWGDRSLGPSVFNLKLNDASTQSKLQYAGSEAYMGSETIMYGKQDSSSISYLPGWADRGGNSVLINGQPINGSATNAQSTPSDLCLFLQPCPFLAGETAPELATNYLVTKAGIQLGKLLESAYGNGVIDSSGNVADGLGTYVRVTGALILDCGHFINLELGHTCFDDDPEGDPDFVSTHQNQEIHPVYSVDIINSPFRPEDLTVGARMNLTGTYGGSDGSTYYVRQIGNTVWWLGIMRDRQPIQRGSSSPIIGTNQIAAASSADDPPCSGTQCWAFANVFKGTVTEQSSQTVVEGDWTGVPQSTSPGNPGGHVKFFVYNHKIIVASTSPTIFPVTIEKMYEPPDVTAPQSTLEIGTPQFTANNQLFVSGTTPFTVTATDPDSDVQNIWYRSFPQSGTAPAYTPAVGSSSTFMLSGSDGAYEADTYATDNAGNDESSHSAIATLDATPPVATVMQPLPTNYGHSDTLTLNYSVSDGNGSGVNSFLAKMDGLTAQQFGAKLDSGQPIYLESMPVGPHTFSVDSRDNLSNAGTNSVTFTITVTFDSLGGDVTNLQALGCIDSISQSLLAKFSAGKGLLAKGQIQAAVNILTAAAYEVQAQTGKHISTTCKDPSGRSFNPVQLLLGDIQYLQSVVAGQLKPDPIMGSVVNSSTAGVPATVNLLNSSKVVVASATADSLGFYYFADVSGLRTGGSYIVNVIIPKAYKSSTPSSQILNWKGVGVTLSNFVLN
jgi:hypothetical protein